MKKQTIAVFAVFTSSFLFTVSFPKYDVGILAWIALAPVFLAARGKNRWEASALFFFMGVFSMMGVFYWANSINGFKITDYISLGVYFGLYYGAFGFFATVVANRSRCSSIVIYPILWVSMEYLRSHAGFLSFPWALLGHSQYRSLHVIQIASFTGVYGISFLIVAFNAVLCESVCHFSRQGREASAGIGRWGLLPAAAVLMTVAFAIGYGNWTLAHRAEGGKIDITVIQGNVPQQVKWDPAFTNFFRKQHMDLSFSAVKEYGTDLVVWPESAVQGHISGNLPLAINMLVFANRLDRPLLVGGAPGPKVTVGSPQPSRPKSQPYNSAFFLSHGKIEGQYNKIRLLPFGEYLPAQDIVPWPSRYGPKTLYVIPGKDYILFHIKWYRFGTVICWESIFPDLFREFVKSGADFMVNITNEAHFGETAAPYQLVMLNVFRAVENRISLVRAANTGISCFIGPNGEILGKVAKGERDIFVEGYLTASVPISKERTFYTRWGDVFAWVNNLLAAFLIVSSMVGLYTKRSTGKREFGSGA